VPLGRFEGMTIDTGDGQNIRVSKWEDLDLALGTERRRFLDAMRKYLD